MNIINCREALPWHKLKHLFQRFHKYFSFTHIFRDKEIKHFIQTFFVISTIGIIKCYQYFTLFASGVKKFVCRIEIRLQFLLRSKQLKEDILLQINKYYLKRKIMV